MYGGSPVKPLGREHRLVQTVIYLFLVIQFFISNPGPQNGRSSLYEVVLSTHILLLLRLKETEKETLRNVNNLFLVYFTLRDEIITRESVI